MNYFFFYKGELIAYTDCKKMKKKFLSNFKDKDNLIIEKVKYINKESLDEYHLDMYTIYEDIYLNMIINQYLLEEIENEASELVDLMMAHIDRFREFLIVFKFTEEEEIIIQEFIWSYTSLLEDCESLFTDFLDLNKILEDFIYPRIGLSYT